eukprot:SAG11_NODE_11609_length_749_cov_1.047692_2_plen_116_part_01
MCALHLCSCSSMIGGCACPSMHLVSLAQCAPPRMLSKAQFTSAHGQYSFAPTYYTYLQASYKYCASTRCTTAVRWATNYNHAWAWCPFAQINRNHSHMHTHKPLQTADTTTTTIAT